MELKRHPSLIFADEFKSLCQPLFKLGIDYFSHILIKDNNLMANGSNPDFFRLYFEQGFQHFDIHTAEFGIPQRYILWDHVEKCGKAQELYQIEKNFGIDHGFTIVEEIQDGKNYYTFSVHPLKTQMTEFYFRHLELLEKFIIYYKKTILLNNRLNRAYSMSCTFQADMESYVLNNETSFLSSQSINDYLETIQQPKINQVHHLSRREMQCAIYLLEGMTCIEIANLLNLSPRTVEVYLLRLKQRFGSKNKIQLARHLMESGLLDFNS